MNKKYYFGMYINHQINSGPKVNAKSYKEFTNNI